MGLTMHVRHALVRETSSRSQLSGKKERSVILNNFVQLTGYTRCGKRPVAFLREIVPLLKRQRRLEISNPVVREQLVTAGDALGNLGNALARSGDARRALECYQELLKLVRDLGARRGEAMVLGNIGKARARPGETRLAIESHAEQLKIAPEIGDRHAEGSALWHTGLALDRLGKRLEEAECAKVQKQLTGWNERGKRTN